MEPLTHLVIQPLIILFVGAVVIPMVCSLKEGLAKGWGAFITVVVLALTFHTLWGLHLKVLEVGTIEFYVSTFGPPYGSMLRADSLSTFMSMLFCGMGLLVAIYSMRYMEEDRGLEKYYALLITMVAGMVGITLSWDFLTFFIFWEVMSISGYVLVGFRKYRWEPVEAGFKYLIMSSFGTLLMFYGVSFLYAQTGTLNFTHLSQYLMGRNIPYLYPVIGMMIMGFGVTAAMVPLHTWLPDAHPAAPSGISAMLSGVVIKAGVYGILRSTFTLFNPTFYNYEAVLLTFGIVTLTVANFMTLLQRDFKRLLAYSSIVNIGYIVSAIGISAYVLTIYHEVSPALAVSVATFALTGGLFHIFNHAVGKGLLFLCSGCFLHEVKTRDLNLLEGVGRRMPWTGTSLSVGLLALAGVPPLNGFWSKLFIILAGLSITYDGFMVTCTSILILNAIFSASYYVWVMQRIMFRAPTGRVKEVHEAPLSMVFPIVILAITCIIVGIFPGYLISLSDHAAGCLMSFILRW